MVKTDVWKHRVVSLDWLDKNKLAIGRYPIDFLDAMMMTNEIGTNRKRTLLCDK